MKTKDLARRAPRMDRRIRERVHDHLKQEILANRYPHGSALLAVPLAPALGVRRGPIRDGSAGAVPSVRTGSRSLGGIGVRRVRKSQ